MLIFLAAEAAGYGASAPGAILTVGAGVLPGRARPEFSGAAPGALWTVSASVLPGGPAAGITVPGRTLAAVLAPSWGAATGGANAPGVLLSCGISLASGTAAHRPPQGVPGGLRASATVSVPRVATSPATGRQVV